MTGVTPLPYPIRKVLAQKIEQNYEDADGDVMKVNESWYESTRSNEKQVCVSPEYTEYSQTTLDASHSRLGGLETFQVRLFAPDEDLLHTIYREVAAILTDHAHMINPTYDNYDENELNQETGIEHFYIWRQERFNKDKKRGSEVWEHVFWVHAKFRELH